MLRMKMINRMIAFLLVMVFAVLCSILSVGASDKVPSDRIEPVLAEIIANQPDKEVQVFVERKAAPLTVEDMPSYDSADRESLYTARQELSAINKELNQQFVEKLTQYVGFTLDLNTNTNIVALSMTAKDVYVLLECDDVKFIDYMGDGKYLNESAAAVISKIDSALLDKIAVDPAAEIQVFVERKAAPLTVEDMPSYDSDDRESLYTARRELAARNKELNQQFVDELTSYVSFTFDGNTNTNIVTLTLKAHDVYQLASCDTVFCIDYMGDGKYINMAGEYKMLGDTDGDFSVTILDATGIQRNLADLGVAIFDADCADYDGDGEVTILDVTAIQRNLAELD